MDNDNIYPNQTFRYNRPNAEQAKAKKTDVNEVLNQVPILKDVISHLDSQIAFLGSVDSIEADLSKSPAAHQKQVAANKLAKSFLERERGYLVSKIDSIK